MVYKNTIKNNCLNNVKTKLPIFFFLFKVFLKKKNVEL